MTESGLAFRRGTPPEATYTFKHALVQDAAYDSLLKTRRQALARQDRARARRTLPHDQRHRTRAARAPPDGGGRDRDGDWLLAEGGRAGVETPGAQRSDLAPEQRHGAHRHAAQSAERDGNELDLRTPLGTAWLALKGWAAPEVWSSFHPALGLAKSLSRHEALVPIYYGLYANVLVQGRVAESLDWVNEMLATAEASGDPDLLIVGHRAACITYFYLGDFNQSREHGDRVLALYSEEKHRHLADIMNTDPKTAVGIFVSLGTWMLGYPDRAVQVSDANDAHARRRGHPFDLGYALTLGGQVWDFRCEPEPLLARVEEAERLGRAHSLPFISEVLAQIYEGHRLAAGRAPRGGHPTSAGCNGKVERGWRRGFGCLTFERSWPKAWR